MERDRGFSFKLLVPPRVSAGQVSAVRPQEVSEKRGVNAVQQQQQQQQVQLDYSPYFDKGINMPFVSSSMATLTKPTRPDFTQKKIVTPLEKAENNSNHGQLYAKLLDEVEKIRCWKVKVDSESVQKERKLQESKQIIETQRKAIQELQFGNESLSIKLEEQNIENEDLRNKNNATRSMCNILKDTLQRSAEKTLLFESEREETHQLFVENSESIQKLIGAFEKLCTRVEADQQEMYKVKEDLLQFEDLKEKYCQEYNIKEKEVAELQSKLKNKDTELQKILCDLEETQKHCDKLKHTTNQQYELFKSSETECEALLQKLQTAEQRRGEAELNHKAAAAALEQRKGECAQIIHGKDSCLQELHRAKIQQEEKLEQLQTTIKEQHNSLASAMLRAQELECKLVANNKELEERSSLLRENMEQITEKEKEIQNLKKELEIKSKSYESVKSKADATEVRVEELTAQLTKKTEEVLLFKSEAETVSTENDLLRKACEATEKAQEDLKEKSTVTKLKVQELEGQLRSEKQNSKEEMEQLIKEILLHKAQYKELLSNFNELQSERTAIQQQLESGSSNAKTTESEERAAMLRKEVQRLEGENLSLREEVKSVQTNVQRKCQETETLQKKIDGNFERLQEKVTKKEKHIKSLETKLSILKRKVDVKLKAMEEYQRENKTLKKQIAKERAQSAQLENVISDLQRESQSIKRLTEKEHQKLLQDLEDKSTSAALLENEVQKLRGTAAEVLKSKEDAELKCQHKIADMVALMEKHKSQYDRMVEEKDADLEENKKRDVAAVAQKKSLELDLSMYKTENEQLKNELKTETTTKLNLQKELTDLKKEMSSMKLPQLSESRHTQSPAPDYKKGECSETAKESTSKRQMFDYSRTRRTPSGRDQGGAAVLNVKSDTKSIRPSFGTTAKPKDSHKNEPKPSNTPTNKFGGMRKIKSYRIRSPPSDGNAAPWRKGLFELDTNSDSSGHNDLTFAPVLLASHCKVDNFKKIQSPARKSPGNLLKLAAMKRMRDAGWTAVTSTDKKKKKRNENIFA